MTGFAPPPAPEPGRQARLFLKEVRRACKLLGRVEDLPDACRKLVKTQSEVARQALVRDRLAAIPIGDLRKVARGNIRLGAIERAGFSSALSLVGVTTEALQALPSVGPTTASAVTAAVADVAERVDRETPLRIDPEVRNTEVTVLLGRLKQLDEVQQLLVESGDRPRELADDLGALAATAGPLKFRLRYRVTPAGSKRRAVSAFDELAARVRERETAALLQRCLRAVIAVQSPGPRDGSVWRDFQDRAAHFYALHDSADGATAIAGRVQGRAPQLVAERVAQQELDTSRLQVTLREYQAFGAKFALVQRKVMLGDEMGLGKTIEAIAAMAHLEATKETHAFVVCPASVLVNWVLEVESKSSLRVHRVHGSGRQAALDRWANEGGVGVTTLDSLRLLRPPAGVKIGILVVDEAHLIKNPETKRAGAFRTWNQRAERVLFLTGTPMENRPEEFQALVRHLEPGIAQQLGRLLGVDAATFRRTVAGVYLRRNQRDVLLELPERLDAEDWVEMGRYDAASYRDAVAQGNFMAMRRAAFTTRDPTRSMKMERLLDIIDESASNGWKVVVYSYFLDVLSAVSDAVDNAFGPLTGSMPPARRQSLIDEFTATDDHAVLVSQIQAGGIGLNIQAASVVIITEPQLKPTVEEQAIGRCHRMGQTRRVHVHRLLAKDSVDERILEMLRGKTRLFDRYARPSEIKDITKEATGLSEFRAGAAIIAVERDRLGLGQAAAESPVSPERGESA